MVTLILNPVAGAKQRAHSRLYEQVLAFVAQHRLDAEVLKTIAPGDGQHLAAVAMKKGRDHVIAIGGDGTVNEVLNGIHGEGVTLGIVPVGITNSIARGLGIPLDWQRALPISLRGGAMDLPVGIAGGRSFLGTAGMGIEVDSQGLEASSADIRRAVQEGRVQPYRMRIDDAYVLEATIVAASVSNIAERASFARPVISGDGRLACTVLSPCEDGSTSETRLRCSSIDILAPSDLALHTDGEVRRSAGAVRFTVAPERQRTLVKGDDSR